MYAVTGSAREYAEPQHKSDGSVRFYLIEQCSVTDSRGNEAGGWEIVWYDDGSATGCVLADMWGWTGEGGGYAALSGIPNDEIFSEEELETIEQGEHELVPAPFGVRYRILTEEEFEDLSWDDLGGRCQSAGRIDHWRVWQERLCA
jgi:hypothetical protein